MGTSLAFSLHNTKDACIGQYVLDLFLDYKEPMTLVNAGQYLQSVRDSKSRSIKNPFQGITNPTAFKPLLSLHALSVVNSQVKHKAMKMQKFYRMRNMISLVVQSVSWTECNLFQKGGLRRGRGLFHHTCWSKTKSAHFRSLAACAE